MFTSAIDHNDQEVMEKTYHRGRLDIDAHLMKLIREQEVAFEPILRSLDQFSTISAAHLSTIDMHLNTMSSSAYASPSQSDSSNGTTHLVMSASGGWIGRLLLNTAQWVQQRYERDIQLKRKAALSRQRQDLEKVLRRAQDLKQVV
jgi:hypothetical protein